MFRNIWRINAVAILLLIVLSLFAIINSMLSGLFRNSNRESHQVNAAPRVDGKPELKLGGFEHITQTNVVRADLRSYEGGSFTLKGDHGEFQNVLYLDTSTGKSWWLLPKNGQNIRSEHSVSFPQGETSPSIAIIFEIRSSKDDPNSYLLLSNPSGTRQCVIAKNIDSIDGVFCGSKTDAKVLYHDSTGYHLLQINPLELVKSSDIPATFQFPPWQ